MNKRPIRSQMSVYAPVASLLLISLLGVPVPGALGGEHPTSEPEVGWRCQAPIECNPDFTRLYRTEFECQNHCVWVSKAKNPVKCVWALYAHPSTCIRIGVDIPELALSQCLAPAPELVRPEEAVLPQGHSLPADLQKRMRTFLEENGFADATPRFESEWAAILNVVFGLLGTTEGVAQSFTPQEREWIRAYRHVIQQDLDNRTVLGDVATIGPDDGSGIPARVRKKILEEKLADLENILHMWDSIAALGGLIPGAASAVPPSAHPRRPVPQIDGRPPVPSSPQHQATRPPGHTGVTPQPGGRSDAPGIGESLIKPDKRSGLGVDMAVQKHREKATYRQGSGRDVESAHMVPSAALKGVDGYTREAALTVLLPKEVHSKFDNHWKVWARKQVAQGVRQVRVDDFLQVLDKAAAAVPELQGRTAETMSLCFQHELYQTLGLQPADLLTLPYAK